MNDQPKYTLVQHSAFGYKGDTQFKQAVELTMVQGRKVATVQRYGGVLFDDYVAGSHAEMAENYPPEVKGLIPHTKGTFSHRLINGLRLYLPKEETNGR